MASSLRDIPGANRRTRGRIRRREWAPSRVSPPILIDPRASLYDRGRAPRGMPGGRRLRDTRRRRIAPVDLALGIAVIAIVGFLGWKLWSATRVDVDIVGVEDDGAITFEKSDGLQVAIDVQPSSRLDNATLVLDGEDLLAVAERVDTGFRWTSEKPLTAGDHELVLTVPRPILPAARFAWSFNVDAVPPRIDVPATVLDPIGIDDGIAFEGRVDTDATLTANGDEVDVDDDGRFRVAFDRAPAGPVRLVATDKAGQTTIKEVYAPIKRPATRGVHMSAISWSTPELRRGVLELADRGIINAIEIDIKDESGEVGWSSGNALAKEMGALRRYFDLRDAVKEMKARGLYVIGRVVAFRDPILARGAWAAGDRDWVLQDASGNPHGAYGGFTNFMNPGVRKYNIDLALEAIDQGVDEILWDYVRRPEGDLSTMRIPGFAANDSVEANIASFLTEAHQPIREAGALQGASVFGIASLRPETIGQSIPLIAKAVDYIAPMTYPSLWVSGEHHVPDPVHMPYEIVTRALEDFQKEAKGTGVTFVPWIQDFSLNADYDDDEVRAQVDAVYGLGIKSWTLWSPRVRYHAGDLEPVDD
jgi:hypothetical protein